MRRSVVLTALSLALLAAPTTQGRPLRRTSRRSPTGSRVVPADADQLTAIVEQLFLGVTSEEAEAGLQSGFSPYTAGQFDDVRVGVDGVVVVDLGPGFVTATNFSTSFMSGQVLDQIAASMFAVADVTGVEFTFEGRRWCGWEAGPCQSMPQPLIARR
jgi:hypothetical protein